MSLDRDLQSYMLTLSAFNPPKGKGSKALVGLTDTSVK
jgi:hypothetical protein